LKIFEHNKANPDVNRDGRFFSLVAANICHSMVKPDGNCDRRLRSPNSKINV